MNSFKDYINEAELSNRKQTLKNQIFKQIEPFTKGMFSDESWAPVHQIFDTFRKMGLDWHLVDAQYRHDPSMPERKMPSSKQWTFAINFTNQNNRPDEINGKITASDAGSFEDPLDHYYLSVNMW